MSGRMRAKSQSAPLASLQTLVPLVVGVALLIDLLSNQFLQFIHALLHDAKAVLALLVLVNDLLKVQFKIH